VPDTPAYFLGVINLRGGILPVIDSRIKMHMPQTELTSQTCILVMEIEQGDDSFQVGALVDCVREVLEIEAKQILPPPNIQGVKRTNEFITGIVNIGDSFIMIIDVNVLLREENLSDIHEQIQAINVM
jgi:chemotaxis signal transduction protein